MSSNSNNPWHRNPATPSGYHPTPPPPPLTSSNAPLPYSVSASSSSRSNNPPPLPPRHYNLAFPPTPSPQQTIYMSGSAAPPIMSHRRPDSTPPLHEQQQQQQQQQYQPPSSTPPPPLPHRQQQTTSSYPTSSDSFALGYGTWQQQQQQPHQRGMQERCLICHLATRVTPEVVRSGGFTCRLCGTENTLSTTLLGQADGAAQEESGVSSTELYQLSQQLLHSTSSPPSSPTSRLSPSLPSLLSLLKTYIKTIFTSLSTLSQSFRPSPTSRIDLPTLIEFYALVIDHPEALTTLSEAFERVLRRPGRRPNGKRGRGRGGEEEEATGGGGGGGGDDDAGWCLVLLECPLLKREWCKDLEKRSWFISRVIGLISNVPPPTQNSLFQLLTQHEPAYDSLRFEAKVDMVVAFVSLRISGNLELGTPYEHDWGIQAAARVGAILFAANQTFPRVPPSAFYVSLIDTLGPVGTLQSFEVWESKSQDFSLCQYPFLLSLGIKMNLLAFDGNRQMQMKAREAIRSIVYSRQLENPFLILRIRRSHLVHDSLREFGMFIFQEETGLCYFNPASFESDEFYLVGVVVGLAIYNGVTLDVPLPLAVYKLLTSEPVSLHDLAAFNPSLASGLQHLLDYDGSEGSVEEVFCRTFVGDYEAFGEVVEVELEEGGREKVVDESNRKEFVDKYVEFLLSTSVESQYASFAEGFKEVASGNAVSLVRGAELELLVRGSPEPLDVEQLKGVTVYEGFRGEYDPTVQLFWRVFLDMSPTDQRKLLSFITGSDRIPATGTSALTLKLTLMGEDTNRFPVSHTCFNQLVLPRFKDRKTMESRLLVAMSESEGFGLK